MPDSRNTVEHGRVQGEHGCTVTTAQLYSSGLPKLFLHGRTPKIIFDIPRIPYKWKRKRNQRESMEITTTTTPPPPIANCRIKFPAIFRIIFGKFRGYFNSSYLFMPRFLARPLRMFWGTLIEKYLYTSYNTVNSAHNHLNIFVRT